ncbi:MAG: phosphotransferase family protein [Acidimicrobiales bacterium]
MSDALGVALSKVLAPELGGDVVIADLARMPGGSSRETWSFTAVAGGSESHRLVLRRDPPGAPSSGLRLEADLLRSAADGGVPVPEVITTGGADGPIGSTFVVVRHVDGETLPKRVQRDAIERGTGGSLAAQCGTVLAAVHRLDPASVPGLPGGDPLEQLRGLLDTLGQPHPAFELAIRHLAGSRPARSAEAVVHGDFRMGNLIVGPEGIRAVLDWELAHRGDPIEDLGWLCVKAWRFGSPLRVGGVGRVEDLLDAYGEATGVTVDADVLRWWETLGTLRWGVICIVQAMTHLSGAVRSVELAAIGRRVCEVEWDLLELLP